MRYIVACLLSAVCVIHAFAIEQEFLVTDFGAKLDGVTDDTVAFQTALDALPDKGVLRIPAGDAILSEALILTNKTIVISGSGSGVTRLIWMKKGGLYLMETRKWNETDGQKASWRVQGIAFVTSVADAGKLTPVLQQVLSEREDKTVYLEADKAVPYGTVVKVMAAIKRAGVAKLGMVAQEPQE